MDSPATSIRDSLTPPSRPHPSAVVGRPVIRPRAGRRPLKAACDQRRGRRGRRTGHLV